MVTLVMNLRFKVPLCGHATLAAATVLFRAAGNFLSFLLFLAEILFKGIVCDACSIGNTNDTLYFQTLSGELTAEREDDR